MSFSKLFSLLADEQQAYVVRQHFASLKQHPMSRKGKCMSLGLTPSCSTVCVASLRSATFGHPKKRGYKTQYVSLPLDCSGSHWSSHSRFGPGAMDCSGQGPVYPSKPSLTLVLLQVRHPASPGFFLTCQSISILKTKSVAIPGCYRHN